MCSLRSFAVTTEPQAKGGELVETLVVVSYRTVDDQPMTA